MLIAVAVVADRFEEAIERYTEAIEMDKNAIDVHVTLYTNRATSKFKLRNYAGAVDDCNAALVINSRRVAVSVARAVCMRAVARLTR